MSKLALVLSAVVLTTGVSVGGVALSGSFSGSEDDTRREEGHRGNPIFPKEAKEFRKTKELNGCLREYFEGLDISQKSPTLQNHLHQYDLLASGSENLKPSNSAKGCLMVDWNRSDYSEGEKWNGNFQLIWAFVDGDNGFIVFTSTEGNESGGKFKLSQLIYLLEKKEGKWEVKEEQDETTTKEVTESNFDSLFLQLGSEMRQNFSYPNNLGTEENWGFMKGAGDLKGSCFVVNDSSCKGMELKHKFHETWNWKPEGTTPLTGWSKNIKKWSDQINGSWNLEEKLKNFKGTWERSS